ncbi:MAG: restriction endonuclease subunit S [Desulfobulbus sp.]|nr:restriction endonuclease subunit S [Desulfobulbus sp.]
MSSESLLFGECASLVRASTSPALFPDSPYIALEHIGQGTLSLNGHAFGRDADSQKTRFLKGDILFGKLRPYFRKAIIAPFDGLCSTDIWVVRPKLGTDRNFLFYWMASEEFVNRATDMSEGTRMPRAKWEIVSKFEIPKLTVTEQYRIGELLGTLDDRITLLRETNTTLEAIAQALFKSWFVDFDPVHAKQQGREPESTDTITALLFPDSFEESELGLVPTGWKVGTLGRNTTINRGISPKYLDQGGVLVINQKCIRNYILDSSKARRHDSTQKKIGGKELIVGDVLVNSTGVGTLGRVAQVLTLDEVTIVDSHVTVVRTDENMTWNYLGLSMMRRQAEIENLGEGTTGQTELSRGKLAGLKLVIPPKSLLLAFDDTSLPMRKRFAVNLKQAETLTSLRDTLLPRLISGQLRLPDAEALVEEAAA